MSFQESKYLVSFLTILATSLAYALRVKDHLLAGRFDGATGLQFLGQSVLWFIGALILFGIISQIILSLLHGLLGYEVDYNSDERDRQIEYRAMTMAFTALSIFFLIAMLGLIFAYSAAAAILTILAGFAAAGLTADLCRLALYRWGLRI